MTNFEYHLSLKNKKIKTNRGHNSTLTHCYITDCKIQIKLSGSDSLDYWINFKGENIFMRFETSHVNNHVVNNNKHILQKLLFDKNIQNKMLEEPLNNIILTRLIDESIKLG